MIGNNLRAAEANEAVEFDMVQLTPRKPANWGA